MAAGWCNQILAQLRTFSLDRLASDQGQGGVHPRVLRKLHRAAFSSNLPWNAGSLAMPGSTFSHYPWSIRRVVKRRGGQRAR